MRSITPTDRPRSSAPLPTIAGAVITLALAVAPARADVTVIYAPAAPPAPLVARAVGPCERAEPVPAPAPGATTAIIAPAPIAPAPIAPAPIAPAPISPAPIAPAAIAAAPTPPDPLVTAPPVPEPAALATRCTPRPVLVVREGSDERASLPLTDCAGASDDASLAELSLLARPRTLDTRPSARELAEHAGDRDWVAAGIRRLHPGLAERLRALADQFPGHAIELLAGFRPDAREGSRHLHGLALDVRVVGASTDAVHAFARRFDRTGVGLHRSAGFVHLDVRARSTHWIDESAPGEPARIVEDDAPRRGPIVRAPEPVAGDRIDGAIVVDVARSAPIEAAAPAIDRATPPHPTADPTGDPAADDAPIDVTELDPDALADQVLRGLGDLSLPPAPAN